MKNTMTLNEALEMLDGWANQIVHGHNPFREVKVAILADKIEAPLKVCEFLCREGFYLSDDQAGRLASYICGENVEPCRRGDRIVVCVKLWC